MKLYNILFEQTETVWYHTTSPEFVESIMKNGLKINSVGGKSRGSLDWMKKAYDGIIPIFLSKEPGRYHKGVILKVDVSGLPLVADIPGLVDFGGHVTEHSIYFDEEETPEQFWDLTDPETDESINGELEFDVLREPHNPITDAAIEVVGTCAVMQDISPDRITVLHSVDENYSV